MGKRMLCLRAAKCGHEQDFGQDALFHILRVSFRCRRPILTLRDMDEYWNDLAPATNVIRSASGCKCEVSRVHGWFIRQWVHNFISVLILVFAPLVCYWPQCLSIVPFAVTLSRRDIRQ